MLNLIVNYQRRHSVSAVSGIPSDWRRSGYNIKSESPKLFQELLDTIDASFLLVSFNSEGFISFDTMRHMLQQIGLLKTLEVLYSAFRGSRNLRNRPTQVKEYLFLVERR